MTTKSQEKKEIVSLVKVASFDCAQYQNVLNIGAALAQAGRFVNILKDENFYTVNVYERANQ